MSLRRIAGVCLAALLASGLLPAAALAANYLSVTISGSTPADAVAVADTTAGAVYAATWDAATSSWTASAPLNDSDFAVVTSPGGASGQTATFSATGSQTVGGDVYFEYTGATTLPAAPATAATWYPSGVTSNAAQVTATVLGVPGPLAHAAVVVTSPLVGVTLTPSAPGQGQVVAGAVYAATDGTGRLGLQITAATAGADVPLVMTSDGSVIATTSVQLAPAGSGTSWPACGAGVTTDCYTGLLVGGQAAPPGFGVTVSSVTYADHTQLDLQFANGESPVGAGDNVYELFGSGPGQIAPGSTVSIALDTGNLDPTAVLGSADLSAWGTSVTPDGYQVTLTATPTALSWSDAGCPLGSPCPTADTDYAGFLALQVIALTPSTPPAGYPGTPSWSSLEASMEGLYFTANAESLAVPAVDPATGDLALQAVAPHTTAGGQTDPGTFDAFVPDALVQTLWGLTPADVSTGAFTGTTSDGGSPPVALGALSVRRATVDTPAGTVSGFRVQATGLGYSTDQVELQPVAPPDLLTATASGSSQVALAWQPDPGATAYDAYVATAPGGPFTLLDAAPLVGTAYAATGLQPATTYYFRVTATTPSGQTDPSATLSATTTPPGPPPPPAGLEATATGNGGVALTWYTDPGANSYNVYAATTPGGAYTRLDTTPVLSSTYTATGLIGGTTYYFYVTGVAPGGEGAPSATVSATTASGSDLQAPTGLTANATGPGQIQLTWSTNPGASGYYVYASTVPGGAFTRVTAAPVTATVFTDTGLTGATTYYFYVTAIDGLGESAPSATAKATTGDPSGVPASPTGMSATQAGDGQIDLSWSAATAATGYNVYRGAAAAGPFTLLTATPTTATTYADTGLAAGTTYYYYVTGTNAAGDGAPSATVSAATAAATGTGTAATTGTTSVPATPPAAPAGLSATPNGSGEIDLTWFTVAGATGYNVYRSASATSGFVLQNTPPLTATSFANTGLSAGTTYYYYVTAVDTAGESGPSATVSATVGASDPPPSDPPGQPAVTTTLDSTTLQNLLSQNPSAGTGGGSLPVQVAPATGGSGCSGALTLTAAAASTLSSDGSPLAATFGTCVLDIPAADLNLTSLMAANPAGSVAAATEVVFSLQQSAPPLGSAALTPVGPTYTVGVSLTQSGGTPVGITALPAPLGLALTFYPSLTPDPEEVVAYRVDGGQRTYTPSGMARSGTIPASLPAPGQYAALASSPTFSDTAGNWAAYDITVAAAHHLVNGLGGGRFGPDQPVTRAQFTAMLVRALGLAVSGVPGGAGTSGTAAAGTTALAAGAAGGGSGGAAGSGGSGSGAGSGAGALQPTPFVDVPAGAWYAPVVALALQDGLVQGIDASHFAPDAPVTREQIAVLVTRALALRGRQTTLGAGQVTGILSPFTDAAQLAPWAQPGMAYAVQAGIVRGRTPTTLAPLADATRAEAAVMLLRFVGASWS